MELSCKMACGGRITHAAELEPQFETSTVANVAREVPPHKHVVSKLFDLVELIICEFRSRFLVSFFATLQACGVLLCSDGVWFLAKDCLFNGMVDRSRADSESEFVGRAKSGCGRRGVKFSSRGNETSN